jgi:flagellar export protein FliJ
VNRVENLLAQAEENRRSNRRDLDRVMLETGGGGRQQIYMDYLRGLDRLMERTREHLETLKKEMERRRVLLEYAVRQRRIMEELRKDERRVHELEERRAETKEYDAMGIRNYLAAERAKFSAEGKG